MKWFDTIVKQKSPLLLLFAALNAIAAYYSVQIYGPFLQKFHPIYWVFVLTCTAPLILSGLLYVNLYRQKSVYPLHSLYCVIANVSYGIIMLILYPTIASFRGLSIFYVIQILSHLVMLGQGLLFTKYLQKSLYATMTVAAWFLLKGYMDIFHKTSWYIYMQYPHVMSEYRIPVYYCLIMFQLFLITLAYRYSR